MQTRNLVIIAGVTVIVAIISGIAFGNDSSKMIDSLAVDYNTVDVLLKNKEHVFVVDIRSTEQYHTGHITGASHDVLTGDTLEKRIKTIQNRLPEIASTYNIVLVDNDGSKSKQTAQIMTEMGIQTFYLEGGMNNLSEELSTSTQIVIDSQELQQKIESDEDIYLLDVREPEELLQSKIEGSVNIPLSEIFEPGGMDSIPTDKPVIVICGSGNRATIASYAMAQEGIDFQILQGGIKDWDKMIQR